MLKSLLWKEWREQRWRMAFGCVLLGGYCAIGLRARMLPDALMLMSSVVFGGIFIPLLAAMGVIGSERETGSLPFLMALPATPRRILAVKTASALVVAVVPIIAALIVSLAIAGERELPMHRIALLFAVNGWLAFHVVVWTLAWGIRQPTEARVGLVGLAVLLLWYLDFLLPVFVPGRSNFALLCTGNPAAYSFILGNHSLTSIMWSGATAVGVYATLWWWASRRIARLAGRRS